MPRLAPLTAADFTPEQQRVADAIIKSRGQISLGGGPFLPWMRSPELADRAQHLGDFCRYHSSLEPTLSEFAIILTAKFWKSQYEFFAHARMAREAGVADAIVEAVRLGTEPPAMDERQQAIYQFVNEYLETHRVSDATYERAKAALTERGVVDLVGIVGYYCLVSMTLNVFEVALPAGEADPLP
ncbi:MAG: carboxymuconolactone decarboxylase family protein [Dehalococcoidia bacterium]